MQIDFELNFLLIITFRYKFYLTIRAGLMKPRQFASKSNGYFVIVVLPIDCASRKSIINITLLPHGLVLKLTQVITMSNFSFITEVNKLTLYTVTT